MNNLNFSSNQPSLLQSVNNLTSNVVSGFVVRPLGSPNILGVSGFLFDILDDEEVVIESVITDHYVEQNYSIQDHIALMPVRFTLRGFVGELTESIQSSLENLFLNISDLKSLGGLLPAFNAQDLQFYNTIATAGQQAINAVNQFSSFASLVSSLGTTATKQQGGFQYFFNMWQTRQLCQVETPFAVFNDMAIERVVAVQSGNNRYISDFTITFKQIKTVQSINISSPISSVVSANTGTTANITPTLSGRAMDMTSPFVNLGTTPGQSTDSSGTNFNVNNTLESSFANQVGL